MKKIVTTLLLVVFLVGLTISVNAETYYVGSRKSDKYHYPSCYWAGKIKYENRIIFKTKEEAKKNRYVPCKVCRP
ncbi:MAG: Ada metal-binding domain-containing protein [Candidatus Firestonebacteria bacterium]